MVAGRVQRSVGRVHAQTVNVSQGHVLIALFVAIPASGENGDHGHRERGESVAADHHHGDSLRTEIVETYMRIMSAAVVCSTRVSGGG